jgi:hypothetical protein
MAKKADPIGGVADLVTSHEVIREGFLDQALEKTRRARTYLDRARGFWQALQGINAMEDLKELIEYRDELLAAASFSDKARDHLSGEELEDALQRVFEEIFRGTPELFREEIFYRYLLTKGDSLGGEMRNATGAIAREQLTTAIIEALGGKGVTPEIKRNGGETGKIQALSYPDRKLIFDRKPKLIGKNIDLILLDTSNGKSEKELLENHDCYLACGELKGGIDPAGSDEHWKTAKSALDRIRKRFKGKKKRCPYLFFVGAVIVKAVAEEIWEDLQRKRLTRAANLTVEEQLQALVSWLVSL